MTTSDVADALVETLRAVPGRRQGKAEVSRQCIDFALKQGKTVHIASPKEGGGVHWTTVLPFRRREEWR